MEVMTTHTFDGEQYTVKAVDRDGDGPISTEFILFVEDERVITAGRLKSKGFEFDAFDGSWTNLLGYFGQQYIDHDHDIDRATSETEYRFGLS